MAVQLPVFERSGPIAYTGRHTAMAVALLAFVALWQFGRTVFPFAFEFPSEWVLPLARWISQFTKWLLNEATFGLFTFAEFTRFLAAIIDFPYRIVLSLLSTGFLSGQGSSAIELLPSISWVGMVTSFALAGYYAGGLRVCLIAAACMLFIVLFGQWDSALVTLSSILVAVPIGVLGGLFMGIGAYRIAWLERVLRPVLDLMQTMPVFAYLVPILIMFGFGPVAAIVATLVYAMPPMTRITLLALQRVPAEYRDLGNMVGCTRSQMTWRVLVPSAKESLMVGVNQVIMLSLNMVIIASMIGAGGLGFDVLAALRRLDFGAGLEAGFAIVALAIALDQISQAMANRQAETVEPVSVVGRHPYLLTSIAIIVVSGIAGLAFPLIQTWPEALHLSTGTFWSKLVEWINVNYFDTLEAIKNTLLLNLLIPFKRLLLDLPWLGIVAITGFAAWRLQGARLAVLLMILGVLIAATGLWEKAMITVYLCGISAAFAMVLGLPIGVLAAERQMLWRWVQAIIDTLQTLPSFVYLMPAVMLFRVGDFTAMIAVVAYAIVPAIRYTALGIRGVDKSLVEAGRAMGCTPFQILTRIKLRLALPEILLGLNQTIMFALSMLVITALVGTRDLGQEVYIALTKADIGRGLVAGFAIAFIAIIADRLISAAARNARLRLGLAGDA